VDPGERVTLNLKLMNNGTGATSNLVATLQPSANVIAPSGPQNYGAVAPSTTVGRDFSFTADGTCGTSITLNLQLQDGAVNLGTVSYTVPLGALVASSQTFSNPGVITIPASGTGASTGAPASPYPSNITVAGAPTTISKVTVTLTNFNHTFPDDVDILLVSPTGRKMIILSDAGSSTVATNLNITLDDAAASQPPDGTGITSGTFRPANYGTVQDPFPAPAPAGPYLSPAPGGTDTLNSAFTGVAGGDPNGTWSLYVVDDLGGDIGNFAGGWSLTLTQLTPTCTTPCGGVRLNVTSTLTRIDATHVSSTLTVQNIGNAVANNVILTTAKLGSTNGTPLPQSFGNIAPGASVSSTVSFINSTPGASPTLTMGGTYTGGSFNSTKRVTIP
jgi:subtilisin-like proprotein convertase family protein